MSAEDGYLKIIRTSLPPTAQQTALFVSYIAGAHSWYKHLPIDRKVPFYVFLDPHAGEYQVQDSKGRTVLRPLTDPKEHIHYTAQKTTDYRRRFGFWNYDAQYGTRLLYRVGEEVVDTRTPGPRIMGKDGSWLPISEEILQLGRAEVDASIHDFYPCQLISSMLHRVEHGLMVGDEPAADYLKALLERVATSSAETHLPKLPAKLQEAIERVDFSPFGLGGTLWGAEELFGKLFGVAAGTSRSKEELFDAVLEHLEFRKTWHYALEYVKFSAEGRELPQFDFEPLFRLFAEKRLRRLRAVKAAMNRVLEFVFGDAARK